MSSPSVERSSSVHAHSNGRTVDPTQTQQQITPSTPNTYTTKQLNPVPPSYQPGGSRSLPGISLHAFSLGIALGLCLSVTTLLLYIGYASMSSSDSDSARELSYLWRVPFFIATLSVFHYLEFDMTARYNTVDARVSSFLLFSNGWAYNVAHCVALLECLIRWRYGASIASVIFGTHVRDIGERDVLRLGGSRISLTNLSVTVGLLLIVVGQMTRSLAMKTAGTSFNHIVQARKKTDHVLVSHGVYGMCRHPSYFGFFWWGLGTQFMLGNWGCLIAYGAILWSFFSHRIAHEEKHLIQFFGQAYVEYRRTTPVLIPFIP